MLFIACVDFVEMVSNSKHKALLSTRVFKGNDEVQCFIILRNFA